MKKPLALTAALFATLVALPAALAGSAADPGVTARTILIGGTAPVSGEASSASAVAKGAEAYFKYVNARGGVYGRKIEYKYVDDSYDPAKTVQAVRELVQNDRVFAIFNTLGTNNNLAVRAYLNSVKVPQLFVATGASTFGRDYRQFPYTIGYIPTYTAEAKIYAKHILQTRPNAKIAVLYQDDAYGLEMLNAFRKAMGKKARQIVGLQTYDPTTTDVKAQIAVLKSSKANTFMNFSFGKFSVQARVYADQLGWKPQIYVNAVAASANLMGIGPAASGNISLVFAKDPNNPKWNNDRGVRLFRSILKKYAPGSNPKDGYYLAGMTSAHSLVTVLRKAGKTPTRAGVVKAAASLKETNNPFVLPGMVVKTSARDRFPLEQGQLQRWDAKRNTWVLMGKLLPAPS